MFVPSLDMDLESCTSLCMITSYSESLRSYSTLLYEQVAHHTGYIAIDWGRLERKARQTRKKLENEANRALPQLATEVKYYSKYSLSDLIPILYSNITPMVNVSRIIQQKCLVSRIILSVWTVAWLLFRFNLKRTMIQSPH